MALAIGTLRLIAAASAPSARIHCALGSAPASFNTIDSGTPVHSLQDTSPWICPHVTAGGVGARLGRLLPEHSRKWMRDHMGYRSSASMLKISDRFTRPWTSS